MYTALVILAIFASLFLILVVLIQNPKGGGLSSSFGGSTQMFGVQKTSDVIEKATWVLAISILSISLVINFFIPREATSKSLIQDQVDRTEMPVQKPQLPSSNNAAPAATPAPADSAK